MTRFRCFGLASCVLGGSMIAACECSDEHDDAGDIETPWLLAIDEDEATIDALIRVSVEPGAEGEVDVVCPDLELPSDFDPETNFTSLAYHGGVLYASAARESWGNALVRIDPCACTVTEVGPYGFALVSGLASTGTALFGIAAEDDMLIAIDPATTAAQQHASLAEDWGSHGLTAGPLGRLYGLDATSDRVYRFAPDQSPIASVATSEDFAAVGLEYHPGRNLFYACGLRDRGTALATLDPDSGVVRVVAESVFMTDCDNLAGPAGSFECVQ
jgi:hypothetical protein